MEINKIYTLFDQFIQQNTDLLAETGKKLQDRFIYDFIFKNYAAPLIEDKYKDDPKFQYFQQCQKDFELLLPVLNYVSQKTLCLQGYTLSIGHCNALARAFEYFKDIVNRIILDNCGVDDEEFASILRGIKCLNEFKKIVYRRNTFNQQSLIEFKGLVNKEIPNNLEELRIENCYMDQSISFQMLEILTEKSYLKRLGLVNAKLNHDSFLMLCDYVRLSNDLIEIDLSWNQLTPRTFIHLIDVLQNNNQLQFINLSNNNLFEDQISENYIEKQIVPRYDKNGKKIEYVFQTFDEVKDQTKIFNQQLTKSTKIIIENIIKFIKKNKKLIHADFSNTGMSEQILWYFGKALRRTKSLRAIHLSGNPGITKKLIQYLKKRVHCAEEEFKNHIDINYLPSLKSLQKFEYLNIEEINNDQYKDVKKDLLKEAAQVKNIEYFKRIESNMSMAKNVEQLTLVLSRKIGHKDDIPGSGQWQIKTQHEINNEQCWICDRQIYSIIVWNEFIGISQNIKFTDEDRQYISQKIQSFEQKNQSVGMNTENDDYPYIYGQFTNWKPQRMFEIKEFCEKIDQNKPNIFKQCKNKRLINDQAQSINDLTKKEIQIYQNEVKKHFMNYRNIWKEHLQKMIKYQKPNIVNAHLKNSINLKSVPLYIFPCFMRSGKQIYFIKQNKKVKDISSPNGPIYKKVQKHYLGSTICQFRHEDVPYQKKYFKTLIHKREFKKETSVFYPWRIDDQKILRLCYEHDLKYWKIPRFVKDEGDFKALKAIVWENYSMLKNQFLQIASLSDFPGITVGDFTIYSKNCQFIDNNVKQSTVDRFFIQVNVELENQGANPDNQLIRFEFIELLIRISYEKYGRFGTFKTYTSAFKQLLDKNVIPHSTHREWQGWRDRVLWTVEVNDLYVANLENLRKIFQSYLSPVVKQMTFEDILDLFTVKNQIQIQDKDLLYCFGMCKMTVADENNDGDKKYKYIQFVEFLELLGRVAHLKFQNSELSNLPLQNKLEYIFDGIFRYFGLKRNSFDFLDFEETQSESDY